MTQVDLNDFNPVEEDEVKRTFTVNDHEYKVVRRDPYHFWYFVGKVADSLQGAYTSLDAAIRAAEAYEASKPKPMERTIISTDGKGGKKRVKYEDVAFNKE